MWLDAYLYLHLYELFNRDEMFLEACHKHDSSWLLVGPHDLCTAALNAMTYNGMGASNPL